MVKAYRITANQFKDTDKPFERLMNIYFLNNNSGLFDAYLLKDNAEYKPYLLNGIVTKFQINKMIRHNADTINNITTNPLALSSPKCNPNNLLNSINNNYDKLKEITDSVNVSIKEHYFTKHYFMENDKAISNNEIVDLINNLSEYHTSSDMDSIVNIGKINDIDSVDYERMVHEKFNIGDEV